MNAARIGDGGALDPSAAFGDPPKAWVSVLFTGRTFGLWTSSRYFRRVAANGTRVECSTLLLP